MQDAGISVTVFFVINGDKCEMATNLSKKADAFAETYNSHRPKTLPPAFVKPVVVRI